MKKFILLALFFVASYSYATSQTVIILGDPVYVTGDINDPNGAAFKCVNPEDGRNCLLQIAIDIIFGPKNGDNSVKSLSEKELSIDDITFTQKSEIIIVKKKEKKEKKE